MTFGDRLKAWRLDHGFTQTDIGRKMDKADYKKGNLSKSHDTAICQFETNKHEPSVYNLCLLSVATGKSIDWWLQDTLNEIKKYVDPNYIPVEQEENTSEKVVKIVNMNDISKHNEDLWKEQHKGCKYKYRKGNFVCELTAI